MNTSGWRAFMVTFCVLFIAQEAATIWLTSTYVGVSGATVTESVAPFKWGLVVSEPSPAYKAGLRTGDLIDASVLAPAARFRIWSAPRAGEPLRYPVIRGGHIQNVAVRPEHEVIDWALWLAIAAGFWTGICALILVLRKPESREVRIIVSCLLLVRLNIQMNPGNWVTPSASADAINFVVAGFTTLGWPLLATYATLLVPSMDRAIAVLKALSYGIGCYATALYILPIAGAWYGLVDPAGPPSTGRWFVITAVAYFILPLLCALAVLSRIRGSARERLAWVVAPIGVLAGITLVFQLSSVYPALQNGGILTLALVLQLLAPLGVTYAMLNRRLLDIGFALNRAAVYAGVSIVIVGIFVLVEWAFGEWFASATHTENLVLSAGLALLLGLSVRAIHHRVDQVLDRVFFRKRHEDEEAIRAFAREAPYITNAGTLLERTSVVLGEHADASFVTVEIDDGRGHYGDVDENDEAIVSLRASHRVIDLHGMHGTRLSGEFAYPMVARGRLVGTLVLGPKRSGESYAPDESNAIEGLAYNLGNALDVLMLTQETSSESVLRTLERLETSVSEIADRLRLRSDGRA